MATHGHIVDEEYLLGRNVVVVKKGKEQIFARIIGIEFDDFGYMLFLVQRNRIGDVFRVSATDCFLKDKGNIEMDPV